jgi:uncharacterized protein with PIN domain
VTFFSSSITKCPSCEGIVSTYTTKVTSPAIGVRRAEEYVEKVTYCCQCGADLDREGLGYK